MNPYRIEKQEKAPADKPPVLDDEGVITWVWLVVGLVLILPDIGKPEPWGPWSSLGMLLAGLATVALVRRYTMEWRRSRTTH